MSMWITVVIEQKPSLCTNHECGVEIHSNNVYQQSGDGILDHGNFCSLPWAWGFNWKAAVWVCTTRVRE